MSFFKCLLVFCLFAREILSHEDAIQKHGKNLQLLGKLSSLSIDKSLNDLRQDDPKLIQILREKYLIPPSSLPYNFSDPYPNLQGQFGQAKYVAQTFFPWVIKIVLDISWSISHLGPTDKPLINLSTNDV